MKLQRAALLCCVGRLVLSWLWEQELESDMFPSSHPFIPSPTSSGLLPSPLSYTPSSSFLSFLFFLHSLQPHTHFHLLFLFPLTPPLLLFSSTSSSLSSLPFYPSPCLQPPSLMLYSLLPLVLQTCSIFLFSSCHFIASSSSPPGSILSSKFDSSSSDLH